MTRSNVLAPLRLMNGSLYVDAEVYAEFFGDGDSVAVLSRDHRIALLSLSPGGVGGSFAKRRNARGDRVIHARELLRGLDLDDGEVHDILARWDAELCALVFAQPRPRAGWRAGGRGGSDGRGGSA